MKPITDKKSSSTRKSLKEKYTRKSPENLLNGDNIKFVKYKEKDVEKLKEKYTVKTSKAHVPFDKDLIESIKSNNENKIEKSPEVQGIVSPKLNVFQFMMNSRNKVIGSNSPGKEKNPEPVKLPEEIAEKKEKIKKRKAALGEWAEKRGGQKRKLADEAQEEHIKYTMKERAKRLKKMLEIIDEDLRNSSHDESDHEVISTKPNKKSKQQNDLKSSEMNEINKSAEDVVENNTEQQNDLKSSEMNEINKNVDVVEITVDTPKRKVTRSKIITESKKKSSKIKNPPENKIKINENEDNNNKEEENKSKTDKIDKKSISNLSLKKNKKTIISETETKTETEQITECTKSQNLEINDNNENIFPINTPLSNKKTRQLKLFQDSNTKKSEEENKSFTPRSWKMKVRLFEKENINEEIDDDVASVIIIDDKESPKKPQIQGKLSSFFGTSSTPSTKSNSSENNKNLKIAPLFLKQQSKKQTKAEIEAKKNFLYSGMPEQVKKIVAKRSINEIEFELFPKISHVQQRSSVDGTLHIFWDLPNTALCLVEKEIKLITKFPFETLSYGTLTNCVNITNTKTVKKHVYSQPTQLPNLKEYITTLKKEYPNYPVFKAFRLLYKKHIKHNNKIELSENELTPKSESGKIRKGRSKKSQKIDKLSTEVPFKESHMWTEKYKPLCHDDIIGNYSSVKQLKCWLQSWLHHSEDQKLSKKRKRSNSCSDDFCIDSDTRDTADTLPQNMIILVGPFGTGKTSSVYALCNELNINVIEINASSKRTGKRILTELQEATQSHQVKNTDSKSVNSFFQKKSESNTTSKEAKEEENKKLSLLLMEDVDIVFDDQDDGFISSLTTLVSSSKRPIILTTSDKNCLHLQKLFLQHDVINFTSISCRVASPWLQILCLIEGVRSDKVMIERLLEWNKGDFRKTILQLQFWIQSGGDADIIVPPPKLDNKPIKLTHNMLDKIEDALGPNDESSNLSWFESDSKIETDTQNIHNSCVECFTSFYEKDKMNFQLEFPINLGNIWWNIPAILNINSIEHKEIFKATDTLSNNKKETENQSDVDCSQNATRFMSDSKISNDKDVDVLLPENSHMPDLKAVADFLESLVFTDNMYVKLKTELDFEPTCQFWQINPVNSLLLTENYEMYNEAHNLSYEISQWLVEQNIKKCNSDLKDYKFNVNVALPSFEERRWRIKVHKSMEGVTDIIPPSCLLDRTGVCKDYFPFMRTICRMENTRFANNNKRKNRFYHYFKTFNIHLSDSTHLILCNSLAIKNY